MFHLEQAAACGDLQALITMAEVYLQLPHDILASATVQVIPWLCCEHPGPGCSKLVSANQRYVPWKPISFDTS